jgi:sugar/nucleoside kinase (ribokinase family)
MRGAEVPGEGSPSSPDLVVIGHVGVSIVHAGVVSWTSAGGSGYAVAASAAALIGRRVGLVAAVGPDTDLTPLQQLEADLAGVAEMPGSSAKLRIREFADGARSFSADLGVAATVRTETFPERYLKAGRIHLGTAPPDQQLTWLEYLHSRGCRAQLSADMFEHYATSYPTASREVCDGVDLIFMNQAEYDALYGDAQLPVPKAPLVVKRGPAAARLIVDGHPEEVEAAAPQVTDPTGGGEVLAGVFLALLTNGLPERDALKYAVRASASCVADYGVTGAHLTAELKAIGEEVGW